MSLAKDESLTLQEGAEQAQLTYFQMTETAAVTERAKREAESEPPSPRRYGRSLTHL